MYNVDNERIIRHLVARALTMQFASDNWSGATPSIAEALDRANVGHSPAYGDDALTARVTGLFCEVFEREVAVLFVGSGTAANLLSLQALARPGGFVLCADQAHLFNDEYNGPEFFTGMKLVPVGTTDARMTPGAVQEALARLLPEDQRGPLAALSITNATEAGTTYAAAEVAAVAALAAVRGAKVHVDGARFANAVVATGDSPAELTWRAGADLMSFGGTKNGCWSAEAIVVFDPGAFPDLAHLRQRAGHGISKQRFIAAQFEAYLTDDAWLATASHANAMTARLAAGLTRSSAARLEWTPTANEVFPVLPSPTVDLLRAAGATFHTWQERGDEEMLRLVTSFATTQEDVDAFLALLP
jgi:threonine aldolase